MTKTRKNWIDAAKVLCILIVVLNHSQLHIPGVNFWGGMFYVPAFFLLAGYTYETKDVSYKEFVANKAKRLLIPYFVANILLFLFFMLLDIVKQVFSVKRQLMILTGIFYGRYSVFRVGDPVLFPVEDIRPMMMVLNAPTWFLLGLFLVLVVFDGIKRWFVKSGKDVNENANKNVTKNINRKVFLVILILDFFAVIYHYCFPMLLPWSLDMLPFYLLLFYVGNQLKEKEFFEKVGSFSGLKQILVVVGLLVLLVPAGLMNGSSNLSISGTGKSITLMLVSAITSTMLLLYFLYKLDQIIPTLNKLIAKLGKHTLTILCYHYFIMQMIFLVLGVQGVIITPEGFPVIVIIKMIIGMVLSIVCCVILDVVWDYISKSLLIKH